MENEKKTYYDIQTLLTQEELKLKHIPENNETTVDAYFTALTEILEQAPDTQRSLNQFAKREGDRDAYRNIDKMIPLLKEVGIEAYIKDFYTILGAYDNGNWRLAGHIAAKIENNFAQFKEQIEAAKTTKEPDPPIEAELLREYIEQQEEEKTEQKKKILAIDDSPVILKSLSTVLGKEYKVYTLVKPTKLEELLKKITPDLFLLDYQMPELNGFELIPIIRSNEKHKETPIVFLTSEGTLDKVKGALELGAADFVVKPFNSTTLKERISKWI